MTSHSCKARSTSGLTSLSTTISVMACLDQRILAPRWSPAFSEAFSRTNERLALASMVTHIRADCRDYTADGRTVQSPSRIHDASASSTDSKALSASSEYRGRSPKTLGSGESSGGAGFGGGDAPFGTRRRMNSTTKDAKRVETRWGRERSYQCSRHSSSCESGMFAISRQRELLGTAGGPLGSSRA